jgi:cell division protein FtsQ
MKFPERLKKPGYKYLAALALLVVVATAPRWSRATVRRMNYFHVRTIEIRGTRYLQPTDIVARLRVDTLRSIVDDVAPLEARLTGHPQIAAVHITRRPPGTLVVTITENLPVALIPSADGLQPFDSAGHSLPIDPATTPLDLPIVQAAQPPVLAGALQTLGALRAQQPAIFARVSEVVPDSVGDLLFVLEPHLRVWATSGVAPNRFRDIFPVEADLARRNERPVELDLRYRDQVVARLP